MDRWERLCSRADTESKILSRFEDNGLSLLMKQAVLKEVVKPSVKIYDLEDTVYNSVISSSKCDDYYNSLALAQTLIL